MIIKMAKGKEFLKVFHTHDCEECVFLGHTTEQDGSHQDVWVCPKDQCLLTRYGQNGDYATVILGYVYAEGSSGDQANKLLGSWAAGGAKWTALDVTPMDQRDPEEEEAEKPEAKVIVGLYEDIRVYRSGDDVTVSDSHDAELMTGRWNDRDSGWYEMHVVAEWVAARDSIMKFRTQRSMFLYAMYLQQLGDDYGH